MGAFGFQTNNYSCGTIAFANAVKVFGIELSYADAKRLVGTTSRYGTDYKGIIRGVTELGFKAREYKQRNDDAAWRWLLRTSTKYPIIILCDFNCHWATVTGRVKNKVIFVDPTANLEHGETGTYVLGKDDFLWRWKYKTNYAIRISR